MKNALTMILLASGVVGLSSISHADVNSFSVPDCNDLPPNIEVTKGKQFNGSPRLEFQKIIGDMRGQGMNNLSVAATEDGMVLLLMTGGRVAVFDQSGQYQQSLQANSSGWWPDTPYLAASGRRVMVGLYQRDYPWVFTPERKGGQPGSFNDPRMVCRDQDENIFVVDGGNQRIQIFSPDNTLLPREIVATPFAPRSLAVRDERMVVYDSKNTLTLYQREGKAFAQAAKLNVGRAVKALVIAPDGHIYAAFSGGPDRYWLKRYGYKKNVIQELSVVAPSYMAQWPNFFPEAVPISTGPDGRLWFSAGINQPNILVLNPQTDEITGITVPMPRPVTIAFNSQGQAYVGGHYDTGKNRMLVSGALEKLGQAGWGKTFPATGLFDPEQDLCWGLLPDADGGVFMRVVESGYQKGWPALNLKKVFPDGKIVDFVDFGYLFAARNKFQPSYMPYALAFDGDQNLILAALPLCSVLKMTPDGKSIWEAWAYPQGGADRVEFMGPVDLTIDGRGNIWTIDPGTNKAYCLSPAGKLLYEYGGYANVDDLAGKGFDRPTGIAAVTVGDTETLYVGDAGNHRIVKFKIVYQ